MRPSIYASVSTALAGGVVAYAFAQRSNFYSACVFLSQSNLSLMILINLCFIVAFSIVWALSRLLYGRLRPIEVEQLYERGWFAVTETCLAMTIFRDEIGAWFITMFVALMAGRVWGWIAHGRVEILEQQPPANPRTFHTRLVLSLLVALAYDYAFVSYAANAVYEQARPNMMVMFLFEYVLLTISTVSTTLKYLISVVEIRICQNQTKQMLEARRAEIREHREEIIRQREESAERGDEAAGREEPLPSEDDVEEMDIEPPGWEGKGQFVLLLELLSDFMRLLVYLGFFAVLSTFFGLPIHIMRDLFVTARSFIKRLNAMLRYRNATRDMNAKYADATPAEISANDTCIICREEMRPWSQINQNLGRRVDGNQGVARSAIPVSERFRPKKLPCGHVLHMHCLKSWLERQQVCPTCRAPVNGRTAQPAAANQAAAPGRVLGPGGQPHPLANRRPQGGQQPAAADNGIRGGMINLGPLRLAYGRAIVPGNANPLAAADAARQAMMAQARIPPGARVFGMEIGNVPAPVHTPLAGWRPPQGATAVPNTATLDIGELIRSTEQRIMEEAARLELQRVDLAVLKRMQEELSRLRTADREQRDQRREPQPRATPSSPPTSATADREQREERQEAQRATTSYVPPISTTQDAAGPSTIQPASNNCVATNSGTNHGAMYEVAGHPSASMLEMVEEDQLAAAPGHAEEAAAAFVRDGPRSSTEEINFLPGMDTQNQRPSSRAREDTGPSTAQPERGNSMCRDSVSSNHSIPVVDANSSASPFRMEEAGATTNGDLSDRSIHEIESSPLDFFHGMGVGAEQPSARDNAEDANASTTPHQATSASNEGAAAEESSPGTVPGTSTADMADGNGTPRSGG